ncbi:radical SAM family heme chaperone HemW [Thalassobaculum litoreum]|uniref:Heme chaperone HemW n=1 Tax=Thalassobaculum litoreum DSM 18839 TaxID=1123362 RepID=A0A8G2EWB2_9PROT|nr:radical SAM family heme chaperone HemW [Thalassobaculum litoreum]SDF73896.1 oxygen-independent coproporphyrinogen-3 oxidase [Thalassobaculum litoreum DSM 18839]
MAALLATDPTARAAAASDPLGLYVHWPFCRAKCPYCDFNSHVSDSVDHALWRNLLVRELETLAPRVGGAADGTRRLVSIFFGGGTPSLMEPETVADVLAAARRLFRFNNDIEITLEANPTSVEAAKMAAFRQAGITRVSLGVQALDDASLRFLGREHSAAEALAALDAVRAQFDTVSFDLIYARPEQDLAGWQRELERAIALEPVHLSLYQLTIEPTTPFYARHARGEFALPDDDGAADLYEATQEILGRAGLPAYEVSNHARPGHECRHNLVYWRYQDYLGIGPGAHGRLSDGRPGAAKTATRTHRAPTIWLDRVAREGHALVDDAPIPRDEALMEAVLMGLRIDEGLTEDRCRHLFGAAPADLFEAPALEGLVAAGFLETAGADIRATAAGRARLDAVTARLLQHARPLTGR